MARGEGSRHRRRRRQPLSYQWSLPRRPSGTSIFEEDEVFFLMRRELRFFEESKGEEGAILGSERDAILFSGE